MGLNQAPNLGPFTRPSVRGISDEVPASRAKKTTAQKKSLKSWSLRTMCLLHKIIRGDREMSLRPVLGMAFIVLTFASSSYGWQTQDPGAGAGAAYPPAPQSGAPLQQYQGVPQHGGIPESPPLYSVQPAPQGAVSQDGHPQYAYPPYHNPYYSGGGMSARDLLSYTVDWIFTLPANVAEQVSNFVDNRFFPQTPATHGSQTQSQIPGTDPSQAGPGAPQAAPLPGTPPAGPQSGN